MTLHCASRLGVVSYLYENRLEIAYQIGLIAEIPIAMCAGDYFEKTALWLSMMPKLMIACKYQGKLQPPRK